MYHNLIHPISPPPILDFITKTLFIHLSLFFYLGQYLDSLFTNSHFINPVLYTSVLSVQTKNVKNVRYNPAEFTQQ